MGKQINYYMEYESFLQVAQKALDIGAVIIRKNSDGTIQQFRDIACVIPENNCYSFYFPQFGTLNISTTANGETRLMIFGTETGNALIEAGFSLQVGRTIKPARLYIQSGYYEDDIWKPRPDEMSAIYDRLARVVKKQTIYTDLPQKTTKQYVSPFILKMIEEHGYVVSQF